MNVNEVLANRANEILGGKRGDVHARASERSREHGAEHERHDPDEHPARRACRSSAHSTKAFERLRDALAAKGREFDDIVKAGRTHLQDAMPIRLGQEFTAYAGSIDRGAASACNEAADYLRDLGIGGSAVGTGVTVEKEYPALMNKHLSAITGLDLRDRRGSHSADAEHGRRRRLQRGASRARDRSEQDRERPAPDGRWARAPASTRSGCPAVQPGSSIMPGKINPSIPEMVNQVCFQVMGCDTTVAIAAEHGQLELNVMMPVIAFNVLLSMRILTNAARVVRRQVRRRASRRTRRCARTGSSARPRWRRRSRRRSATRGRPSSASSR